MHKWVQRVAKIIFVIVVLVLIGINVKLALKEEIQTESKAVKTYEISQSDIVSSGQEIIIQSFSSIDSVKWIDNDQLYIEGIIDDQKGSYVFDTSKHELMTYQSLVAENVDFGAYTFILEIPEYGALCTKDTTIGLLKDGEYKILAENATFDNQILLKISEDLTKMLYYHHDKETLVTYNFDKDFYRTINAPLEGFTVDFFKNNVQISPIGGYVSIEYSLEILGDSYFSIYGADSGRLYADEVYGTQLSWSPDDEYLCYYYTKESMKGNNLIDEMNMISNRIGYYDVNKKSIKYLDSSQMDRAVVSKIYWDNHKVTALTGEVSDMFKINGMITYDFDSQLIQEIELDIPEISNNSKVIISNMQDRFILYTRDGDSKGVVRIMKETHEVLVNDSLNAFNVKGLSQDYFVQSGYFISFDQEKVIISGEEFEGYMFIEHMSFDILPTQNMSYIALWDQKSQHIHILSIK